MTYEALFQAWRTVYDAAGGLLDPIETPEQHTAAMTLLDVVWDAKEERPELGSLLSLLVENIHHYEEKAFPDPVRPPGQVLASLMAYQQVSLTTLAQATGISSQELARLLADEQDFCRNHMHVLAEQLRVTPDVFV